MDMIGYFQLKRERIKALYQNEPGRLFDEFYYTAMEEYWAWFEFENAAKKIVDKYSRDNPRTNEVLTEFVSCLEGSRRKRAEIMIEFLDEQLEGTIPSASIK